MLALLVTRRQRLPPRRNRQHVEIPVAKPVLILDRIDVPNGNRYSDPFQRRLVEQATRSKAGSSARASNSTVNGSPLVTSTSFRSRTSKPASFISFSRLAQIAADRLRTAANRIGVGGREDLRRDLARARSRESPVPCRCGKPGCHQFVDAVEVAADARVLTEEDLLVHLLEIERIVECASDPGIAELARGGVFGTNACIAPDLLFGKFLLDARACRSTAGKS